MRYPFDDRAQCEDVVSDTGTPVDDRDYQVPFPFKGEIQKITLTIDRPKLTPEDIKKLQQAHRNYKASEYGTDPSKRSALFGGLTVSATAIWWIRPCFGIHFPMDCSLLRNCARSGSGSSALSAAFL